MNTLKTPPLRALQIFEVVARHQSITKAAEELYLTHASVSLQMRQLSEYLGITLFNHVGRNIQLTPNAKLYATSLSKVFNEIKTATDQLNYNESKDHTLNIAMPNLFAMQLLWLKIAKFNQLHPEISVRIVTPPPREANTNLRSLNLDLLIFFGNEIWDDYQQEVLVNESVIPLISPKLAKANAPLNDIKNFCHYPLITTTIPARKNLWQDYFAHHDSEFNPKTVQFIQTEDSTHALMAAISGLGIVLMDKAFANDYLAAGKLIAPVNESMHSGAYQLIYARESLKLEKVKLFREWLLTSFVTKKLE
ncbi:LysR substrate-binding domain-containing protein [Thiotrichales bacterium 19S3-7]|nr:LysR substrate-binding domain-containing protein [Thiotrichales bacterium 19S3-7]MCF6800759.1 LysR substrate-binding domain-containing protein [Thiotrichales bacterium 19S3-11]